MVSNHTWAEDQVVEKMTQLTNDNKFEVFFSLVDISKLKKNTISVKNWQNYPTNKINIVFDDHRMIICYFEMVQIC